MIESTVINNNFSLIPLGKNAKDGYAIIDLDDLELVSKSNWWLGKNGYVYNSEHLGYSNGKRIQKSTLLHRHILNPPDHARIDHINNNPLDCRKKNLRYATVSQNAQNRPKQKNNKSGYKGVHKSHNKTNPFRAQIKINHRSIKLGYFKTAKDAHQAYLSAAKKHFGEFAHG